MALCFKGRNGTVETNVHLKLVVDVMHCDGLTPLIMGKKQKQKNSSRGLIQNLVFLFSSLWADEADRCNTHLRVKTRKSDARIKFLNHFLKWFRLRSNWPTKF